MQLSQAAVERPLGFAGAINPRPHPVIAGGMLANDLLKDRMLLLLARLARYGRLIRMSDGDQVFLNPCRDEIAPVGFRLAIPPLAGNPGRLC